MKSLGTIEAVKAVTDIYAPLGGEVTEVNEELKNSPGTINQDPYGTGWIVKLKMSDPKELDSLLSSEDYEKLLGESH
jgi:glycine cleavage system H protein